MTLGAPLTLTENGIASFTLPAGHPLTESNLRQMATRHGEFACIAEADERSDEQRAADLASQQARLDEIFSRADLERHPALAGLYAAVQRYRSA